LADSSNLGLKKGFEGPASLSRGEVFYWEKGKGDSGEDYELGRRFMALQKGHWENELGV